MPHFLHFRKLSLFAFLSLTDLALTRFLLSQPGGGAYESNPFASWCLAQFGWCGLVLLKVGVVVLTAGLTLAVSRRRPRIAGGVLAFGCAALLGVVVYSSTLVPRVLAQSSQSQRSELRTRQLESKAGPLPEYLSRIIELRKDLVFGRRSLAEAVEMLATTQRVHDPEWLRLKGLRFPGYQGKELLAAVLIEEAVLAPEAADPRALYHELDAQIRVHFGRLAPSLRTEVRVSAEESDLSPDGWRAH